MTGVILAGGQSRRMGFNKAFIEIDGSTIIERAIWVFRDVFDEVFIAAGDVLVYADLDVAVVSDVIKDAGSLGGVYTALFHANADKVFVAACDMPFLDAACIRRVIKTQGKFDAVTPFISGRPHPMHTLYSRRCMKHIEAMIQEGNLRITDLFDKVRTRQLTEDAFSKLDIKTSITNVNTREELEAVIKERGVTL
ncbi:MAG: molybdenum cofactor guanylyltransferase [Deltaproteobacteria bacterium]|nr:molybdenum cofactor guanylyltransferase [Deltaproteobacteria bacterium]